MKSLDDKMLVTSIALLGVKFVFCFFLLHTAEFYLYFIAEMVALSIITILSRSIPTKFLSFFCMVIESAQLANIHATGNYIAPLTILNIQEYHVIGKSSLKTASAIMLLFCALSLPGLVSRPKNNLNKHLSLIILISCILVESQGFPVKNFIHACFAAHKVYTHKPTGNNERLFARKWVNSRKSPLNNAVKYNIVVVFMEGTSYAIINDALTPNLESLKNNSLNVVNYYNHTAATYRGLRGTLSSAYQLRGGRDFTGVWNDKHTGIIELSASEITQIFTERSETLPEILNANGYHTVFLSPHSADSFNSFVASLGFNHVFAAYDYAAYRQGATMLTDREMYQFLWDKMQELGNSPQPFFLAMYTVGTHHGMDSPDKTFGDGKNTYLNKFHNHDHQLGDFFRKFVSDNELYRKTIFIITSDHATYSTPLYRETFSISNPHFVDAIPFIIHYNGVHASALDARYKNSLSFAPTLLDLTQIEHADTHFLGDSLFDRHGQSPFAHISFVNEFFVTDEQGIKKINPEDRQYKSAIELIRKFFDYGG